MNLNPCSVFLLLQFPETSSPWLYPPPPPSCMEVNTDSERCCLLHMYVTLTVHTLPVCSSIQHDPMFELTQCNKATVCFPLIFHTHGAGKKKCSPVFLQCKHGAEGEGRFMCNVCSSCLLFKVFPVCASWYDGAADSCNKSFGVFWPVLPMVCIFHSLGTFANNRNHKYSICSHILEHVLCSYSFSSAGIVCMNWSSSAHVLKLLH